MTNRIAFVLVLLIAAAFVADRVWFGGELPVFLLKQLGRLTEWMAFWR